MRSVSSYGHYVIVPPPLPSWGSPSASLSAWGEGAPQPLPWGSHRPENQVCLPEDVIVQIMHSPLIITSHPAVTERHTEDRGDHGPCHLAHLGSHPHSVDARTDDKPQRTGLRMASTMPSSSTCQRTAPRHFRFRPVTSQDVTETQPP